MASAWTRSARRRQHLWSNARSAVSDLGQTLDLKGRVDRNPYGMVAAAIGVGYVLGGGLFTPLTGRILKLGVRLAMLPFVKDELLGMAEAALQGYQAGQSSVGGQSGVAGRWVPRESAPRLGPVVLATSADPSLAHRTFTSTAGVPTCSVPELSDLKKLDKDDLLNLIGLETRKDTSDYLLPALGAFTVGVLLGVGVGLMLAPKPGNELRNDLRNRFQPGQDALTGTGTARTAEGVNRNV